MTITADIAAKGVILRSPGEGRVVFHPHHASYELDLLSDATFAPGEHVRGVVRCKARKVYTVPSGGGFVQPVLGTPRIVQGRVVTLDEREIVVRAGNALFAVELPTGKDTVDLHAGDIAADSLVNVVVLPGARFETVD